MQIVQMRKMGGLGALIDKLPGQFAEMADKLQGTEQEKAIARIDGIINSMTPHERTHPEIIKASRKRRIATGSGVSVQEVNRLLKQFEQTQKIMKHFTKGGLGKLMRGMKGMMPGVGPR
ncbi:MAG: signal recognition particle protein, partial [Rhodocyclaceae bacterium]|nr:signal recognition particle protein [Rhodocyclaceae bacterium]